MRVLNACRATAAILLMSLLAVTSMGGVAMSAEQQGGDIGKTMAAIETRVKELDARRKIDASRTLTELTNEMVSLLTQSEKVLGRGALTVTQRNVIQAGEIKDERGKAWIVLACGGRSQVSTLAWPAGSTDAKEIKRVFPCSIGRMVDSRIAVPATQPAASSNSIPIEFLVDGSAQHAALTIDSRGTVHATVDGWQNTEPNGMVWGRVGGYGYHNVDVEVATSTVFKHPAVVRAMHFLPDGRLALSVDPQLTLEIMNVKDGAVQRIDCPQFAKRFLFEHAFSRDGRNFILPYQNGCEPALIELPAGKVITLSSIPEELTSYSIDCDAEGTLALATNSALAVVSAGDKSIRGYDLVQAADGSLTIVPRASRFSEDFGTRPGVSFNGSSLAIRHTKGTFVFRRTGDGWSVGQRVKDWWENEPRFISLSPDGRWLASSSLVFDLVNNTVCLENGTGQDVSWSLDSTLVARSPGVLCTLGREKLAIRIPLTDGRSRMRPGDQPIVALSPDGAWLALSDRVTQTLNVYSVADLLKAARK